MPTTTPARDGWDVRHNATLLSHLLKAHLQHEEAQRQREENRGPHALFKTTLTMWTRTKPDVGRDEDVWETIRRIDTECDPILVSGPGVELVDDPSLDSEDGWLLDRFSRTSQAPAVPKNPNQSKRKVKPNSVRSPGST